MSIFPPNPSVNEEFSGYRWNGEVWEVIGIELNVNYARQDDFNNHTSASTTVHGISNTGNLVYTNDSRLTDQRTPLDNSVTSAKIVNGTILNEDISASAAISPSKISGTAVVDNDARLTNARTPTAHASTHASGGSDAVTIAQSQVTNLTTSLSSKVDYELPVNNQSGTTYIFTLDDARRLITATNANAKTFTIPPQTSVTWANNSMIRVVNYGAGALTIAGGLGVTVTNTATTIAQYQGAVAIRTGSDAWTLVPFGGGAISNANFSNTATGTYSADGKNYKFITFTGSGTLSVTKDGFADVVVVGGGGGSGVSQGGAGGAGGYIANTIFINTGTYTVTIGGGGGNGGSTGPGGMGGATRFAMLTAEGGGGGGFQSTAGGSGGSGGGGGQFAGAGGAFAQQGRNGGSNNGGGGGAGGIGANGFGIGGPGTGGVGLSSSITGSAVFRAGGGAGYAPGPSATTGGAGGGGNTWQAGAANTGGGGGADGGTGGSGVVIVRVAV